MLRQIFQVTDKLQSVFKTLDPDIVIHFSKRFGYESLVVRIIIRI
jgi:hypothetical protein